MVRVKIKKIRCPKCKKAMLEMFGITEGGLYKYNCPRCYYKTVE